VFHPPEHTALALCEISPARDQVAAFEALRGRDCPWLLDSALPSARLGRFSFAGADPYLLLRARGGRIELECRRAVHAGLTPGRRSVEGDFFETARELLPRLRGQESDGRLPFVGGALCALGYELAEQIEDLGLRGLDDLALPHATLLFVDRVLIWDHRHERLFAAALGFGARPSAARESAERGAAALTRWPFGPSHAPGGAAQTGSRAVPRAPFAFFDEGTYSKAVDVVKQEISRGNVYQACLTHRLERDFRSDPWRLYRTLRRINPAPFACYLELPGVVVVGSSPERFLCVGADRRVESRPIKGTRPRGRHAAEDAANRAALEGSAKDRAENLMIVDLVRNDLGRVCETGSVEVPELMVLEEYASVFQMVSTVTGRLREDRDALDLIRATFPPGSMTGAPKIAAMQLLGRLEPVCRGVYSGAIGYLDARGGADLSVVIRTLLLRGGRAYLHTGGAVVADSDPHDEWRETLDKARPLLAALDEVDEAS
jgi:aminodeoxychorismate synthase component I